MIISKQISRDLSEVNIQDFFWMNLGLYWKLRLHFFNPFVTTLYHSLFRYDVPPPLRSPVKYVFYSLALTSEREHCWVMQPDSWCAASFHDNSASFFFHIRCFLKNMHACTHTIMILVMDRISCSFYIYLCFLGFCPVCKVPLRK